ncbi:MAG: FtsX-like permease family protein, partial [Vicinamibacterales bacterium]
LARGISTAVGTLIGKVSGVAQASADVTASPTLLALALVIGILTSLVAAFIPARAAARIDPVKALQKGRFQLLSAGENRFRAIAAGFLGLASLLALALGGSRAIFYTSYLLVIVMAVLLTPVMCLWLARMIRPILKWIRPVEGALAADSLVQSPRRTSASVAALMLSLALVIAFAGMARSSFGSIVNWVNTALNPDLFVLPSPEIGMRTIRFPAAMGPELAAVPGVARVQTVREARVLFRGSPVMLVAVDFASVAETTHVAPVAGRATEMYRAASAGEGVVVSDNLAQLRHLSLGETLDIPAPGGLIRLPIVGIVVHYADQRGVIMVDRSLFQRYWHDDSVNFFRVYLTPGVTAPDAKRRILERYAGQRRVFVLNNDEVKGYIVRITNQWFALSYVQIAVAVFVAILGIVNTLTVSITDRRRELGVLRAVGGLKGQIRHTIWIEALGIGVLGLVLGFLLGAVNLYYILEIVRRDVIGMRFGYQFPGTVALGVIPVMLAAAFVAAWWPAELSVRGSLVEALEYE